MEKVELGTHILSRFNEDLEHLRNDVLQMGGLAEAQLQQALQALAEGNAGLAGDVITNEARVNLMEVEIDDECNRIRHAGADGLGPAAGTAIIKTITDLSAGDEAHKIANIGLRRAGMDRAPGTATGWCAIWGAKPSGCCMGVDVFALPMPSCARVAKRDRVLDEEYDAIQRQCITFMIEDPRTIRASIDLLWVARALERVGDHAKNICEYVIYMVGGRDVRHVSLQDVERSLQLAGVSDSVAAPLPPGGHGSTG
jgi:phosphate transport system protein